MLGEIKKSLSIELSAEEITVLKVVLQDLAMLKHIEDQYGYSWLRVVTDLRDIVTNA